MGVISLKKQINESLIKDNYKLYNRIQNEKRRKLLLFIYEQARNYTQLIEYSGLKPGPLYHHLNILEPLIEKLTHGQYTITEFGREVVEKMNFVDDTNRKPLINRFSKHNGPLSVVPGERQVNDNKDRGLNFESNTWNDPLAIIWLGNSNYILITLTISIMILLGIQGISFAGSAIYAVGGNIAFSFDIIAFILGLSSLYYLEMFQTKNKIYNQFKFIFTIRIISMIPGTIVGISLLLLYMSGENPPSQAYPWIFGITLLLGTFVAATGIHYLRGQPFNQSLLIAVVPGMIDLLLGLIVLISGNT